MIHQTSRRTSKPEKLFIRIKPSYKDNLAILAKKNDTSVTNIIEEVINSLKEPENTNQ